MKTLLATVAVLSLAVLAIAATQVIDGANIDSTTWGVASIAVQDTNTGFGDNYNELNQMFVDSDADNVYVGLTGNLADNNHLAILIDTDVATGNHPVVTEPDPINVPCVGVYPKVLRYYNAAILSDPNAPAIFTPDYALTISVGIFPGQDPDQLVYACDLVDLNSPDLVDGVTVLGIGAAQTGNGLLTGASGTEVALDNSNTVGVGEWSYDPNDPNDHRFPNPAYGEDPTEPTTGIEIAIPRALIGLDVPTQTDVSFFAFISDNATSGYTFPGVCNLRAWGSNQAMPGLAGWGNMMEFNGIAVTDPNDPNDPGKPLDLSANPGLNYATTVVPGTP
jgi:hypothetical protein